MSIGLVSSLTLASGGPPRPTGSGQPNLQRSSRGASDFRVGRNAVQSGPCSAARQYRASLAATPRRGPAPPDAAPPDARWFPGACGRGRSGQGRSTRHSIPRRRLHGSCWPSAYRRRIGGSRLGTFSTKATAAAQGIGMPGASAAGSAAAAPRSRRRRRCLAPPPSGRVGRALVIRHRHQAAALSAVAHRRCH